MLKRLQQKKSDYDVQRLRQDWKKQKAVIKNIANFPLISKDSARRRRAISKQLDLGYDDANGSPNDCYLAAPGSNPPLGTLRIQTDNLSIQLLLSININQVIGGSIVSAEMNL